MGKKLSDTHHYDKKGKVITISMQAYKEITKITNYRYRRMKSDISFDVTPESALPVVEISEDENTNNYDEIDVKTLISNLGLNEKHFTVLNGRLNGLSFSQIAQAIQYYLRLSTDDSETLYGNLRLMDYKYDKSRLADLYKGVRRLFLCRKLGLICTKSYSIWQIL